MITETSLINKYFFIKGSRADIKKHMSEKHTEHIAMVTDRVSSVETKLGQFQRSIQEHQVAVENRANNYHDELASLRDDFATLRAAVDRALNRSHEVPQGTGKPDADQIKDLKMRLERVRDWPQEAQARFARARLCLPYNKGRKETLRPK